MPPKRCPEPVVAFVAKFVPIPGHGWPDENARRKRLLKLALRCCGLRCTSIGEEPVAPHGSAERGSSPADA